MTSAERLRLYEKAMLLILKDREGTIAVNAANHVLAGALLSELLLEERIVAEGDEHLLVPRDPRPVGEPLLDECLELIRTQPGPLPAKRWVPKLGALPGLHHRVARGLCQRGILREDEGKVLLFFTRRVYPEVDPAPEQALIESWRARSSPTRTSSRRTRRRWSPWAAAPACSTRASGAKPSRRAGSASRRSPRATWPVRPPPQPSRT